MAITDADHAFLVDALEDLFDRLGDIDGRPRLDPDCLDLYDLLIPEDGKQHYAIERIVTWVYDHVNQPEYAHL